MSKFYFAYGMNTNIDEMRNRCPDAINLGRCTLKGFELKFRLHADIDQIGGAMMEGVLWEITPECERALDNLEGYPYYYDKIEVIVNPDTPVNNNTHCIAMAYTMTNKCGEEPPSLNYQLCLVDGYVANGLDADKLTGKINSLLTSNV